MSMSMSMSMSMGLGGNYQMGGAVPAELGPHPLTLDFSPDPMHPEFPRDIVTPRPATFDPKLWDSSLYALLALREFSASSEWTNIPIAGNDMVGWQTDPAVVDEELAYLRSLMENDRANYLPEIIAQHENAPFYWVSLLGMTNGSKPKSMRLMQMAMRIGEMISIHYKEKYRRVRPSVLSPGLAPPFGPPGHPAFPSGHSLQGWLITESLMHATRATLATDSIYKPQLKWMAKRVAANRERAGVHYQSDSLAGQYLAGYVFDNLLRVNGKFPIYWTALQEARVEWGFQPL